MNRRVLILVVVALAAVLGWRLYQQSNPGAPVTQPPPTAPADTASATAGEASGETPSEDTAETGTDAVTATEGTGDASLPPETATDVAGVADALAGVAGAATDTASATDPAVAATGTTVATASPSAGAESLYLPEGYTLTPFVSDAPVREFSEAGDGTEEGRDYRAVIETTAGRMVLDLYEDETPVTVNSFVWLARNRYYDGIVFHRVIEGFMAQTGDPTGTGTGGPGYTFGDEFRTALRHTDPGIVSMANAGPGTNGSQIFITFVPTPNLDNKHTVFGKVVEGEDVLGKITRGEPPENPTRMERVYIVEKAK